MNQDRLLGLYVKLRSTLFVVTGALIISSAAIFLLNHGCFNCTMVYWLVGTDVLASWVYPTSVLIIGAFFIAYGIKFGLRGVGLVLMVCGAFDVIFEFAVVYFKLLLSGTFDINDGFFWSQNALMFGGYLLAGMPKFTFKGRYFLMACVALLTSSLLMELNVRQFDEFYYYQIWEVFLFLYVLKGTALRKLPGWMAF